LLYVRDGANTQYVTGSSFIIAVCADYLASANRSLLCGSTEYFPPDLIAHSKSQVFHSTFPYFLIVSDFLIIDILAVLFLSERTELKWPRPKMMKLVFGLKKFKK